MSDQDSPGSLPGRTPFKIVDHRREKKFGIVAGSLEELVSKGDFDFKFVFILVLFVLTKLNFVFYSIISHYKFITACEKLEVDQNSVVKIVLDMDGTEVDDEEYFETLESNTVLMLLVDSQKWVMHGKPR